MVVENPYASCHAEKFSEAVKAEIFARDASDTAHGLMGSAFLSGIALESLGRRLINTWMCSKVPASFKFSTAQYNSVTIGSVGCPAKVTSHRCARVHRQT